MNKIILLITMLFIICACSRNDVDNDLKAYVDNVKARPSGNVEDLPEILPYEGYVYSASLLRNPFEVPKQVKNKEFNLQNNGIGPDMNRPKEPLENYALDSLKMLGTLRQDGKMWAIVADPEKVVHRITKGNYIGMNHGKVMSLQDDEIKILEIVPGGNGSWQEKEATLVLSQ